MRELIENKIKVAKSLRISSIILTILLYSSLFFLSLTNSFGMGHYIPFAIFAPASYLAVAWVIYFHCYITLERSVKLYKKYLNENITNDISSDPMLPFSNIHCGSEALFCRSPNLIVPYSEIAYISFDLTNAYGGIGRSIVICTKKGQEFKLNCGIQYFEQEFNVFLDYILKFSPDIIIGDMKEYARRYPDAVEALEKNRKKKSIFIRLPIASVAFVIFGGGFIQLIKTDDVSSAIIFGIFSFISGIIVFKDVTWLITSYKK